MRVTVGRMSQSDDGCCVARRSWSGPALLCVRSAPATGNVHVTREPEVERQPRRMTLRSMRKDIINHAKERTWSLSWYSGDQLWQLIEMLSKRRRIPMPASPRRRARCDRHEARARIGALISCCVSYGQQWRFDLRSRSSEIVMRPRKLNKLAGGTLR